MSTKILATTAEIPSVSTYSSHFDSLYPWSGIRRCVVDTVTGEIKYYLKHTDSTKKEDDTEADLSGISGEVMVKIPIFSYKVVINADGTVSRSIDINNTTGISLSAGYQVHPAFIRSNGTLRPYILVGAYIGMVENSTLHSRSGTIPTIYSAQSAVLQARNNSRTGRNSQWNLMDFYIYSAIQMLYSIEFQSYSNVLTNKIGTNWNSITGSSNLLGSRSGCLSVDNPISYRGLEGLFGYSGTNSFATYLDGCYMNGLQLFLTNNSNNYGNYAAYTATTTTTASAKSASGTDSLQNATIICSGMDRQIASLNFSFLPVISAFTTTNWSNDNSIVARNFSLTNGQYNTILVGDGTYNTANAKDVSIFSYNLCTSSTGSWDTPTFPYNTILTYLP